MMTVSVQVARTVNEAMMEALVVTAARAPCLRMESSLAFFGL